MGLKLHIGFGLAVLLAGCATVDHTPHATVGMLIPASSNEATHIRQVAILPFDGYQGREFSAEIQAQLASVKIGDKPYFQVADRAQLDHLFSEIRLSQSGAVSHDQALRLGKLLRAKGLYTGTQGTLTTNQSYYQEKRRACADGSQPKDLLSALACQKFVDSTVNCTQYDANFTFSVRLTDTETGQVVYARTIPGAATARSCSDRQPAPTAAQLADSAKQKAFSSFLHDVAPSIQTMEVQLLDVPNGTESESARAKLAQGIAFATAGRMDRACELWGEARESAGQSPAIYYDLGVCAEWQGEVDRAADLYKQADRMLLKPDDRISLAMLRTDKARRDSVKFAEQVRSSRP